MSSALLKVLPKTAKKVAVLDRTKEPGSLGELLYLDVAATLREAGLNNVVLTGGRYEMCIRDRTETVEAEEGDEPTAEQLAAMEAADEASASEAPSED